MIRTSAGPRLNVPVGERDHIFGRSTAEVTMVEYGDYECRYCGQAHQVVKELHRRFGSRLQLVFRHFPLTMVHPHAQRAAEAAEAAGAQGRFWEMHDMLFEHQQALDDGDLTRYARTFGLNMSRFAAELNWHMHAPRVREEMVGGARGGVLGTPTFFINGVRHDDSFDLDVLMEAIGEVIEAAGRRNQQRSPFRTA